MILKLGIVVAGVVMACAVIFALYIFLRAKGPWRQRIRDNFGGGT